MSIRTLFNFAAPEASETEKAQQRLDESVKNVAGTGEMRRRLAAAYRDFEAALRGDEGMGR